MNLSQTDGDHNRRTLQDALDHGSVTLPPQRIPLSGGLVMGSDRVLAGAPGTILSSTRATAAPAIHILGAGTAVRDLSIELPYGDAGQHDGARFTAMTIGDYLYPTRPEWIDDVTVENVAVTRPSQCAANSIAVMGAVRGLTLRDISIAGGGTGIAVHWGAVAVSVAEIIGPSFHPYDLVIERLVVRDAFEGFYLSSVHDVTVSSVTCDNVEIGFRLLPGDNADSYHEHPETSQVSQRIAIRDVRIGWRGIYGIRAAGWGRSEVDHSLRRLPYRDVTIESCDLIARHSAEARPAAAIVTERADGVGFAGLTSDITTVTIDGQPAELIDLPAVTAPARTQ